MGLGGLVGIGLLSGGGGLPIGFGGGGGGAVGFGGGAYGHKVMFAIKSR